MPLEAVMLVLDNSAHAINGDYAPSRFGAQRDAANVLFAIKTNSNPENVVGLMTMAGRGPEVLVTPTQDEGKIVAALHNVKLAGDADMTTGIQVAQLALKHRQNKNQRQRVIVFVGSPLAPHNVNLTEANLVKLGKKMKKNNVAVDVVSFGSENDVSDNDTRLRAFVDAVNSGENSHFVTVPAGIGLLSDQIRSSGMLAEDGAGGPAGSEGANGVPGASGSGAGDGDFGVDPNLDPELAMALRMSLEEERARQAGANAAASSSSATTLPPIAESEGANTAASTVVPSAPSITTEGTTSQPVEADAHTASVATSRADPSAVPVAAGGMDDAEVAASLQGMDQDADNDDEELQMALAMSRGEDVDMDDAGDADDEDLDEDAAIARAIAMSMAQDEPMEDDQNKNT